jgi:perosamine synthetase
MNDVEFVGNPADSDSNVWLNAIALRGLDLDARDVILKQLNDANYMSRPIWTLMHRLPMYADCPRAALPQAERLEREIINLPSSANLADA